MDVAQNLLTRSRGATMSLSSVYAELRTDICQPTRLILVA